MTTTDGVEIPVPDALSLAPIAKLDRDMMNTVATLGPDSTRYLVDTYYQIQESRKALANQIRAVSQRRDEGESTAALDHFLAQVSALERQMGNSLSYWSDQWLVGRWAKSQVGVGPILTAAFLAHIDITKANTAGSIWRYAGLDPSVVWNKGEKRPYNARLKVLCWRQGDSFVKQRNREGCFYGQVYESRKNFEVARDLEGYNAEEARRTLETKNIRKPDTRQWYESGHLPPGRLDLRARRYAVKLYLSHWHEVAYWAHHGTLPPLPYPIANPHMPEHSELVAPPNAPDGLVELRRKSEAMRASLPHAGGQPPQEPTWNSPEDEWEDFLDDEW